MQMPIRAWRCARAPCIPRLLLYALCAVHSRMLNGRRAILLLRVVMAGPCRKSMGSREKSSEICAAKNAEDFSADLGNEPPFSKIPPRAKRGESADPFLPGRSSEFNLLSALVSDLRSIPAGSRPGLHAGFGSSSAEWRSWRNQVYLCRSRDSWRRRRAVRGKSRTPA